VAAFLFLLPLFGFMAYATLVVALEAGVGAVPWPGWLVLFPFIALVVVVPALWIRALRGVSRVVMDDATLTIILAGRPVRAGWHEIAEICAVDVPLFLRDATNQPHVLVRLRTPSGAPVNWATIPDQYTIGRDELAAALQRRHAEALLRPDPGQAARFGNAEAAIRRLNTTMLAMAAAFALGPLVLFGLILLGRGG